MLIGRDAIRNLTTHVVVAPRTDRAHFLRQLRGADDTPLNEALGQADQPALVVTKPIIKRRGQCFDVLTALISRYQPFGSEQCLQRIDAAFPVRMFVLSPFHLSGRPPAKVVVLPLDHPFVKEGRFASLMVRDGELAESLAGGFQELWRKAMRSLREVSADPRSAS